MKRLQSSSGKDFLWSGDPEYWKDCAPLLFPFIGRLTKDRFSIRGKKYAMPIHGFASEMDFEVAEKAEDSLTLKLSSNRKTLEMYPFVFSLKVSYRLNDSRLEITYLVENHGTETMPFGIGGHPGFRLPMETGRRFEDYVLEFSDPSHPDQVLTTPAVYLNGQTRPFSLQEDRILPLNHRLFDNDAITLQNVCRKVSLHADTGPSVVVEYPQMNYLGLWHTTGTDAPFLCIEPWSSLPSRQDIVEDLTAKSDLIHLSAGKCYENQWSITIVEENKYV